jgi:hypothetical protein
MSRLNLKANLPSGKVVSTVHLKYDGGGLREWDEFLKSAGVLEVDVESEFESMVFPAGSYKHLHVERYKTEAEARAGHERLVKEWSEK